MMMLFKIKLDGCSLEVIADNPSHAAEKATEAGYKFDQDPSQFELVSFAPDTKFVTYTDTLCDGWIIDGEYASLAEAEAEVTDLGESMYHGSPDEYDSVQSAIDDCGLDTCPVEDFIQFRKFVFSDLGGVITGKEIKQ
jgi:hypothetical protein